MLHARPHLNTHNRIDGHSAVAGAAYRMGLKLYDRRLKRSFDFRKRSGSEVVFATTVAPAGAPVWATDPLELWNRVEAAERRKDAQLARDYRVPLPLGLTDEAACAMAIELAEYIAKRLTTPVSIGVHRDAPITAFGETKTEAEVGCHAHLYFPTRKILLDEDATSDAQSGGSGMGDKLTFLSNKATSGYFVEDANRVWAETANRFAAAAGITPDYDHRSYRRQGLKIRPQPRLGEAATAMERAGKRTERGDRVREAQVMAEVYQRAHAARAQAKRSPVEPRTSPSAAHVASDAAGAQASHAGTHATASQANVNASQAAGRAPAGGATQTLFERFKDLYCAGVHEGIRPQDTYVYRLVDLIDRAMRRIDSIGHVLFGYRKALAEATTAHLDAKGALSDWRKGPPDTYEHHERQPLWNRMVQGMGQWMNPPDPIVVKRQAQERAQVEQRLVDWVDTTARRVEDLKEQMQPHERRIVSSRAALRQNLRELREQHEEAVPLLMAALLGGERNYIEGYLADVLEPSPDGAEGVQSGTGRLGAPKLVLRPFRGHA